MTAEEGVHAAANEMTDCFDGLGLTWEERELITRAEWKKARELQGKSTWMFVEFAKSMVPAAVTAVAAIAGMVLVDILR